jgi:hypothetical protein
MKSDVFEGTLNKEDAQEIKKFLQEEKENGNRFVSFPTGKEGLVKEDFTPFKSAIDAQQHAYNNTTDKERHSVRSIPVAEKEIDLMLGNKKEQAQETSKDRTNGRSRDQELSR